MRRPELGARLRLGYRVFAILVAIEATEYLVGTDLKSGAWPLLAVLAVIGAWPIVQYFMHIGQLRRRGD